MLNMDSRSRSLDDLVLKLIDETLVECVGLRTKQMLFDYVERNCSLSRSEIGSNPAKFFALLEEVIGEASRVMERAVVRKLYKEVAWVPSKASRRETIGPKAAEAQTPKDVELFNTSNESKH